MLVLTRKKEEAIVMDLGNGRQISVRVISVNGGRAKLGIEAPADVRVCRGELLTAAAAEPPTVTASGE